MLAIQSFREFHDHTSYMSIKMLFQFCAFSLSPHNNYPKHGWKWNWTSSHVSD